MINKRKMSIQGIFIAFSIVGPVLSIDQSLENGLTCGPGKFPCDKFRCIPERWVCDRSPDCLDGTDELEKSCPDGVTIKSTSCKGNQYQCDNGFCLPIKWKCDGADDCGDGSDERPDICKHNCTASEFTCGDGQCIANAWKCDGNEDCVDGADEKNCSTSSAPKEQTSSTTFKCVEGSAIPIRWRCDGDLDCRDGSDEKDCVNNSVTISDKGGVEGSSLDAFRSNCREGEFKCPGSYCILASWVCDGSGDCSNSEDELNCTNKQLKCKRDEFKCEDLSGCVKKTVLCDGIKHCFDNSDEANCSKAANSKSSQTTTTVTPKTQTNGKDATSVPVIKIVKAKTCNNETEFTCNDGKCIAKSKLCNGESDCKNQEDESIEECGVKECARNNGGCMQLCIDTKEGHHCSCGNGYILVGKYSCVDINECVEVPGICSQECVNTEGSYHCSCLPGYTRDPANYTRCKASEGEVYLLFSHSYDIRSLRLRDRDMTSVVQHTRGAIALDYLFDQGQILWSDKKDKKIYRASLANTENREILVSDQEICADGLAVDWIHRNVYYTDIAKSSVRVLSWDAKYVKTLINEAVGHPRAIVVSPHKGYIYWTDWGSNAKIERATLDGSDRQAIVSYPHVVWPNGLTIDHSTERIYWCDGRLRTISKANLDGSNVEVILYSPVFLRQPFSISVFEDRLYWTDWSQVALFSADKFTGSNIQNVSAGHLLESPKVVHVYHQYRQPKTDNICNDHQCSHFCMRSSLGFAFCSCADDYELATDKMACVQIALKKAVVNLTTEGGREINFPPAKEMEHEISVTRLQKLTMAENESRVGFIIGCIIGAMFGVAVIFGIYVGFTKVRRQPIKRIKFSNPIYRKTTVDDDDGRGYIIGQDQLFYNPTRSNEYQSEAPLTDADDAPLTPKDDDDDIV